MSNSLTCLDFSVSNASLQSLGMNLMTKYDISQTILLDILPSSAQSRIVLSDKHNQSLRHDILSSFSLPEESWLLTHQGWFDASFHRSFYSDPFMANLRFRHLLVVPVVSHKRGRMGVILLLFQQDKQQIDCASVERDLAELTMQYGYLLLQERHRDSLTLFNDAAEFAKLGFWYRNTDTEQVFWSPQTYLIFGEQPDSFQPTIDKYYSYLHPDDLAAMKQAEFDCYANRQRLSIDHRIVRRDGEVRWVHLRGQISWNENDLPVRFFGIIQDITEQKHTQLAFRQASMTDYLTDLGNRRGFIEHLNRKIEHCSKQQCSFCVTYLDLDYFKEVNDVYGHETGDNLLNQFGSRLLNLTSKEQYIARIGGDEFAVIHEQISGVDQTLQALLVQITRPFQLSGIEVQLSVSMGSACFPRDAVDSESLMARADDAMFAAKRSGRNCSLMFNAAMHEKSERRALIREGIKRLDANTSNLFVVYQPIVKELQDTPHYFEALVRWQDPELGMVPPDEFIPIAEETGLIRYLSELIMTRILRDMEQFKAQLPEDFCFSVNLSPQEVAQQGGGLNLLLARVQEEPWLAKHFIIEITETAFLSDEGIVKQKLQAISELGIKIALDDFGTGYSSLTHIREYPIQILKIDKSFVQDYQQNKSSRSIVDTIIYLADSMSLRVVAEGVETSEVAQVLSDKGNWLQGYLISRPSSLTDLLK